MLLGIAFIGNTRGDYAIKYTNTMTYIFGGNLRMMILMMRTSIMMRMEFQMRIMMAVQLS